MLKHLDLFSGIGGWTLGFHATEEIETVGFCEIEKYPQQILKQHYPNIPIFEDVKKLDYEQLRTAGLISDTQRIDIITCSYPCQPFSVAGKKQGEKDPRHLWPEVHRLIRDDRIRPMYVLGENVGGHIRQGLDTVSEDMERCGYRWRCFSIEAACIGANHRRQRVWWIAEDVAHREEYVVNTDSLRQHEHKGRSKESKRRADSTTATPSKDVALSKSERHRGRSGQERGTGKRNIQSEEQEGSEMGSQTKRRSQSHGTSTDVADTKSEGRRKIGDSNKEKGDKKSSTTQPPRSSRDVAHTGSKRLQSSRTTREVGSKGEEKERRTRDKYTVLSETSSNQRQSEDVAHTNSRRRTPIIETRGGNKKNKRRQDHTKQSSTIKDVAHTVSQRGRSRTTGNKNAEDVGEPPGGAWRRNWDVEPNVGRVAHGIPNRVHRLKALGNAIVPQMAYYIGTALIKDFQTKTLTNIGENDD